MSPPSRSWPLTDSGRQGPRARGGDRARTPVRPERLRRLGAAWDGRDFRGGQGGRDYRGGQGGRLRKAPPQPGECGPHPEHEQSDDGEPRQAADRECGQVVRQRPCRARRSEARCRGTGQRKPEARAELAPPDARPPQLVQVPRQDYTAGDRGTGYADADDSAEAGAGDEGGDQHHEPAELDGEHNASPGQHHEVVVGQLEEDGQRGEQGQPEQYPGGRQPARAVGEPDQRRGRPPDHQAYRQGHGAQQRRRRQEGRAHGLMVMLKARECGRRHIADGQREHGDGPGREVQRECVEAEGGGAEHAAHHELVHVGDGERHDRRPGQRSPVPQQRAGTGRVETEPQRLGRERYVQHRARHRAGDPAHGQAHRAQPGPGQADGHHGTEPAVDLVRDHPAVLAEAPVQQPYRRADQPVEHDAERQNADNAGGRRRPHRRGVPGRAEEADGIHDGAARHGDGSDSGRDLGRITRPADDGQAHRHVVEAQHGQQGHPRDGVGAESVRAEHPRQDDPDPDRAQPAERIADEGPAKGLGCRGRQGGLLGRPGAARGPHVPSPRGAETGAGPMPRPAGPAGPAPAPRPLTRPRPGKPHK